MVFWGFSLILAVSCLGRQAEAVPRPQGEGGHFGQVGQHPKHPQEPARITMGNPTTAAAAPAGTAANAGPGDSGAFPSGQNSDTLLPPGATSTTPTSESTTSVASTSIASSTPTFNLFESIWHADQIYVADLVKDVSYQIDAFPESSNGNLSPFSPVLFICQTSSGNSVNEMNSSNTWAVAHIPSMCLPMSCILAHLTCSDDNGNATIISFYFIWQNWQSGARRLLAKRNTKTVIFRDFKILHH